MCVCECGVRRPCRAGHKIAPTLDVEPMGVVLEGLVDTLIAAGALPLGHRPDTVGESEVFTAGERGSGGRLLSA